MCLHVFYRWKSGRGERSLTAYRRHAAVVGPAGESQPPSGLRPPGTMEDRDEVQERRQEDSEKVHRLASPAPLHPELAETQR